MGLTDDPTNSCLHEHGPDGMQNCYLVLSEAERAKGFVRAVRTEYKHVGRPAPANLRDLTDEERERYEGVGYVKFEEYPEGSGARGRFWKQEDLDRVEAGCGAVTWMALPLAETYAARPEFYSGTWCGGCKAHFPVGPKGEFVWVVEGPTGHRFVTEERVGT